jgi:polyhydroxybutyrate depolymerase
MPRSQRFIRVSVALAAGWWAIAACSETGTASPSLPDRTAPPLYPGPNPPNQDLRMPPATIDPAYRVDDNGVIPNGVSEEETPPDVGAGAAPTASDAGPAVDPAAGEQTTGDGTPVETLPPAVAPPETAPPETPPDTLPAPETPTHEGDEFNDPTPITPSAGCERADPEPPRGLASLMIRGMPANYLVTLPEGDTGEQPLPLIFGFHGRARTFLEFEQIDAKGIDQELGSRAIMVYPQAQGGEGWTQPEELPPSIEFFEALYQMMLANYCVDTSHVFAVGHSSGGFFSHILACRYGERLRGIGVVAGTLLESDCRGYVAALMIHGIRDTVVDTSRGVSARDFLLQRNGCTPDTQPGPDPHCVTYQGCEAGLPIAWCEHDEPTYDDTNHGWPSFATHTIAQFLFSLP